MTAKCSAGYNGHVTAARSTATLGQPGGPARRITPLLAYRVHVEYSTPGPLLTLRLPNSRRTSQADGLGRPWEARPRLDLEVGWPDTSVLNLMPSGFEDHCRHPRVEAACVAVNNKRMRGCAARRQLALQRGLPVDYWSIIV